MKEFDDFADAQEKQASAVQQFSSAHANVNLTTSDLASKGNALKAAIDDAVLAAAGGADRAKAAVSTPTQTGSATLVAGPGTAGNDSATEAIAPAPEPQIAAG